MALGALLDAFFTEEWARFNSGLSQLNPEQQRLAMQQRKQSNRLQGDPYTVNIPGWDDVIKLGPRYQATDAERAAYYGARRTGAKPNISGEAFAALEAGRAQRDRIRTSAQPGYAQAFGEILTAVDNVQDFMSTVATFGSLAIWGASRAFNAIAPGASAAVAAEAGALAARTAQAAALAVFDAELLAAARLGEPVARQLLGDEARRIAAQRAAVELAGREAYQLAFRRTLLGLGARLALRALPIVGFVLLASDLLNLLSLVGMVALPGYALLCHGPDEALAAGVPAAVFKKALKQETWKAASLNPFSRQAQARRLSKAARGLPGFSQLIEVAQTTEQLFGYGVSLGGLTGALMETAFGAIRFGQGQSVGVNTPGWGATYRPGPSGEAGGFSGAVGAASSQLQSLMAPRLNALSAAQLATAQQAATVLTVAPAILGVQEEFTDAQHLEAMVTYAAALSHLAPLLRGLPWQELAAEMASASIRPPGNPGPETLAWAEAAGVDLDAARGWWLPGRPATITGREYAEYFTPRVIQATRDFFIPRRNSQEGAFYGALVNSITEALWLMLEDDPEYFRWSLTSDTRLLASLTESGRLVPHTADEAKVWKMWQAARRSLEAQGATSLTTAEWDGHARDAGVTLIRLLPPGSDWPEPWQRWAADRPPEPPAEFADLA